MKKPQSTTQRKERTQSKSDNGSQSNHVSHTNDHSNEEYSVARRRNAYQRAPFDLERLEQESREVQNLFWAIQAVRVMKNQALELYQQQQAEVLAYRMRHEKEVRDIKKSSLAEVQGLTAEFNRIKRSTSREIHTIRTQISL